MNIFTKEVGVINVTDRKRIFIDGEEYVKKSEDDNNKPRQFRKCETAKCVKKWDCYHSETDKYYCPEHDPDKPKEENPILNAVDSKGQTFKERLNELAKEEKPECTACFYDEPGVVMTKCDKHCIEGLMIERRELKDKLEKQKELLGEAKALFEEVKPSLKGTYQFWLVRDILNKFEKVAKE